MKQDDADLDGLVRKRLRALRVAQGWSLDALAARARLSPSTLSRIENGQRRLALDQLVTLARALDTSLDQLVETATEDVVSNPVHDTAHQVAPVRRVKDVPRFARSLARHPRPRGR